MIPGRTDCENRHLPDEREPHFWTLEPVRSVGIAGLGADAVLPCVAPLFRSAFFVPPCLVVSFSSSSLVPPFSVPPHPPEPTAHLRIEESPS